MEDCKSPSARVIVVGAGAGGVALAARLAAAGCKVTVIEKNNSPGGRSNLIHRQGYRFDQGPIMLILTRFFHETFEELGTSLYAEGVKLVKCDPNYHIFFHDNTSFISSTDLSIMKQEIEKLEGRTGFERFLSFLQEGHRHYELSTIHIFKKNFPSIWSMFRLDFLSHLLTLHPFQSAWYRASSHFQTDKLRKAFTFADLYIGVSPFNTPGTHSLLQYAELVEGIWYPIGGFHKVIEGLVNVSERLGVEYIFDSPVRKISLSEDGQRATGIVFEDNSKLPLLADLVVCNADLVYAYNNLLPESSYSQSLLKREASMSTISFYWGLNRQFPELSAYNMFLPEKYKESFDRMFKKYLMPEQTIFFVHVPSRLDPSAAPEGCDSVSITYPISNLQAAFKEFSKDSKHKNESQQDWEDIVATARDIILKTIKARLGIDLGPCVVEESFDTPLTWKSKFNLDRGAVLGLSHSFTNLLSFRPKTKHASIEGLYFVGASTHPGSGVPVVLAGAKLVSEQILEGLRQGSRIPWGREKARSKIVSNSLSDWMRNKLHQNWLLWIILCIFAIVVAVERLIRRLL